MRLREMLDMKSTARRRVRTVKIHYQSKLFKLPLLRQYSAIVLGRHCFVKEATASDRLIRHELVHQEQIRRHGVILFYFTYVWEYLRNLWRYRSHDQAYRQISFEVEAYARETDESEASRTIRK
ncbi:MAG: hypothetical protein EOP07_19095 [Proteobacteria bacterium]|nr:MAG: hypothetical protein EOP07_19095 [Pseudomonadota bacterium]